MRRFYYETDGKKIEFYLGAPSPDTRNVLFFQAKHLQNSQNIEFPGELIQSLNNLFLLSKKYKIRLDQLCAYILTEEEL